MKSNVGALDGALRIALGIALLALVFVGPQTPLGLLGAIPLLSGLAGHCPLYRLVGVSTCNAHRRRGRPRAATG